MTQQEFTDRTGMTPTPEQFNYIHAVYMNTRLDKDPFCADWKKHGESRIIEEVHITAVNYTMKCEEQQSKINETVELLIGKSRAYNDTDFRKMAVRLVGEKEVVMMTLKMELPLWDEDREYIVGVFNR